MRQPRIHHHVDHPRRSRARTVRPVEACGAYEPAARRMHVIYRSAMHERMPLVGVTVRSRLFPRLSGGRAPPWQQGTSHAVEVGPSAVIPASAPSPKIQRERQCTAPRRRRARLDASSARPARRGRARERSYPALLARALLAAAQRATSRRGVACRGGK